MKTKISSKHFKDSNLDSDQNEESSSSSSSSSFKEDSILSQRLLPVKKTHKKKKSILKGFYVIEEILDKKKDIGGWKYKIKWMGYSINECTWEPIENLCHGNSDSGVHQMINEFEKKYNDKNKQEQKKKEPIIEGPNKVKMLEPLFKEKKHSKKSKKIIIEDQEEELSSFEYEKNKSDSLSNNRKESCPIPPQKPKNKNHKNLSQKSPPHKIFSEIEKNIQSKQIKIYTSIQDKTERISSKGRKILSKKYEYPPIQPSSFSESEENLGKAPSIKRKRDLNISSEDSQQSRHKKKKFNQKDFSPKPESLESNKNKKNINKINKKPIISKISNSVLPKKKGSFLCGDKAEKIVSCHIEEEEINCNIQWKERKDGTTPTNSYFSNTLIKEYDPILLINFYESNIRLTKKKKNAEKKTQESEKSKKEEILKQSDQSYFSNNEVFHQKEKSKKKDLEDLNEDEKEITRERSTISKIISEAHQILKKTERKSDQSLELTDPEELKSPKAISNREEDRSQNNLSNKKPQSEKQGNEELKKITLDNLIAGFSKNSKD